MTRLAWFAFLRVEEPLLPKYKDSVKMHPAATLQPGLSFEIDSASNGEEAMVMVRNSVNKRHARFRLTQAGGPQAPQAWSLAGGQVLKQLLTLQ